MGENGYFRQDKKNKKLPLGPKPTLGSNSQPIIPRSTSCVIRDGKEGKIRFWLELITAAKEDFSMGFSYSHYKYFSHSYTGFRLKGSNIGEIEGQR